MKAQGPNARARSGRARAKRKTEVLKGHWKTMETKTEARHLLSLPGGGGLPITVGTQTCDVL